VTKPPLTAESIEARLREVAEPDRAQALQRFFRTGPGEYGEGDVFMGVRVPDLRRIVKEYRGTPLKQMLVLLRSQFHEARLLALLLMVDAYSRSDDATRQTIYDAYLANTRRINSWDLVDASAEHIVGAHLFERDRSVLDVLARSDELFERRIAIIATFHYIKRRQYDDTLRIAGILLQDREDLIHKAVGWMLREVGKRDQAAEEAFLRAHCRVMPRTMLRYAIERFEPGLRQQYMKGEP
jgi:3-methyladenine DNA glycosylase AlkD